jgi:hypothetical protein
MDSGTWHVNVEREGRYALTLRRWPKESGLGITAPAPEMVGFDGSLPPGRALPVSSAWLGVGNAERTTAVPADAAEVTFEIPLVPGPAEIKSWWIDEDGNRLAGAFYLSAERVE